MRERRPPCRAVDFLALALIVAWLSGTGSSADPAASRTDWNREGLRIGVSLVQTEARDGEFGATKTTGSASALVAPDAAGVFYVGLGSYGPDGSPRKGDPCSGSVGSHKRRQDLDRPDPTILASHPRVWWIVARPVPTEFGRVGIDATWSRWEAGDDGRTTRTAGGTRRIVMEEGAVHALDWIGLPAAERHECASDAAIQIGASVAESPSVAAAPLSFDLWFEHRVAGGEPIRRRFRGEARPGEAVAFRMEPVRVESRGDGREVLLEVDGTLRARLLRAGTLMVEVRSSRSLDLVREDGRSSANLGLGHGRKVFETRLGNTTSILLPDPLETGLPYAPSADTMILTVNSMSH